jgi:hypothetical protein
MPQENQVALSPNCRIYTMLRIKLFFLLVSSFAITHVFAQQLNRFAYIQTDNNQPFYIKWNAKIWSSSNSGYLILPKIKDPQISIIIGFPKNLYPEQEFTITFNGNKDAGFILKNFGDKGWGLYNLQTLAVVYATNEVIAPVVKNETTNSENVNKTTASEEVKNPFGNLLVQVTQDSSVTNITVEKPKETVVKKIDPAPFQPDTTKNVKASTEVVTQPSKEIKQEIKKVDPLPTVIKVDSNANPNNIVQQPSVDQPKNVNPVETVSLPKEEKVADTNTANQPVDNTNEEIQPKKTAIAKSSITLIANLETAEEREYLYIVKDQSGVSDSVQVVLLKEAEAIAPPVIKQTVTTDSVKSNVEQPKFLDIIIDTTKKANMPAVIEPIKPDTLNQVAAINKVATVDTLTTTVKQTRTEETTPKKEEKLVMYNTDCKTMASEKDFLTLRKKMVAENDDEDMITAARKVFKTRCFTTDQIKNLCVLFLKDEGRYKFLDAAYPYVYNTEDFKSLVSLLTEEYYIRRFEAMIKK